MRLASQIALAIAVVASLSGGVFLLAKSSGGRGIEIVLPDATVESRQDLKVYVTGAVVSPGVYEVADGGRRTYGRRRPVCD